MSLQTLVLPDPDPLRMGDAGKPCSAGKPWCLYRPLCFFFFSERARNHSSFSVPARANKNLRMHRTLHTNPFDKSEKFIPINLTIVDKSEGVYIRNDNYS